MKKIILLLITLLSLTLCFTACEEESSIYSDPDSKGIIDGNIPDDGSEKDGKPKTAIYKAYKESIDSLKSENSYEAKYSLFDIDANSNPELILNPDEGKYKIYAFDGNALVYSGGFKSKDGIFIYDGMFFATTEKPDFYVHAKISLDESLKVYDIGYPYITREGATDTKYTFNKETITADEYSSICNDMSKLEFYPTTDLSHLDELNKTK